VTKEENIMNVSERAKEKLDEAGREIKEAIDNLKQEVERLSGKVKDKIKGTGAEVRESVEELSREVRGLSERVKDLIPKRRKNQMPVRVEKFRDRGDLWEPPFWELNRSMDPVFRDFFGPVGRPGTEWRRPWQMPMDLTSGDWPRVDVTETDDEVTITAELPGVQKDNIDVSVTHDSVTIRGEKKEQEERRERGYHRLERSYGSFHRSLHLPCEVEPDKVDAIFRDGVLTVKLPKSAEARSRTKSIPIKTG
jgi:HSP20 family protein